MSLKVDCQRQIMAMFPRMVNCVTVKELMNEIMENHDYSESDILWGLYDLMENETHPCKLMIHPVRDTSVLTLLLVPSKTIADDYLAHTYKEHKLCTLPDFKNGIINYLNPSDPEPEVSKWKSMCDQIDVVGHARVCDFISDFYDNDVISEFMSFLSDNIDRWSFFVSVDYTFFVLSELIIGHDLDPSLYREINRSTILNMIKSINGESSEPDTVQLPESVVDNNQPGVMSVVNQLQDDLSHVCTEMHSLMSRLAPVLNDAVETPQYETKLGGSQVRFGINICVSRVEALKMMVDQLNSKLDI